MTRLRRALNGVAEEAPMVDLADLALAGHRRRRRVTALLAAATVVTVAAGATTAAVASIRSDGVAAARQTEAAAAPLRSHDAAATPQPEAAVPDLPGGRVGPLAYAYPTPCEVDRERKTVDCAAVEWRVVTRSGTTYRLPQALAFNDRARRVPVAISRDGRMLAYYSRHAQAHVVRDLVDGSEVTSPVTVKEERIGIGSMLVVSDDGRHVAFDPREGSKEPGLLIDVRTGKTVRIPGKYEPVSIKDGVAELVRYVKTDLWLMPVTGGGRPVRFAGTYIIFSELAPDGRTVAAVEMKDFRKRRFTLLDTAGGRAPRKVTVRGLPEKAGVIGTGPWRSGSELTLFALDAKGTHVYGVDIGTGRARRLADHPGKPGGFLVLPGVASG
ncbi:hypothetical protein [Streptosporangium pseudovulgare]|uniref:Lipoprotein LpqB beta-propeller domain-containing protein n=1 Tax=Streptosporangium pseudovulgare TaxID=35765 RepID=A0ABQ2R703_9ACTN|nr:hypothetical protein [Streptosporangium pseudovulgare]GGQ14345.1 hypothetical protein GCM10010140_50800 [Streptosporangium pseudovulgare]